MYLSVTMIILGEALLAHSVALAGYWAVWFVCANLFVIVYEEPTLRRTFGDEYEAYFQRVSRWLPTKSKKEEGRMILRRYRWLSVEKLAADTAASTSRGRGQRPRLQFSSFLIRERGENGCSA